MDDMTARKLIFKGAMQLLSVTLTEKTNLPKNPHDKDYLIADAIHISKTTLERVMNLGHLDV